MSLVTFSASVEAPIKFSFSKLFSKLLNEKYSYFIKRISDTKTYNLDKESLFMEFNEEILNG